MVDNELKTFVLLKYEILTSDSDTWKRCEDTYPESVKSNWAWRCAAEVEHLANGYPEAEEFIRIAKLYRDGKATMEELEKAWNKVQYAVDAAYYYEAAAAAYYAADAVYYYASSAARGVDAAYHCDATVAEQEEKWKLYISWLIEELCAYEKLVIID